MEIVQITANIEELLRKNFKSNGAPIPFTYGGETYDLRNRQARIDVIGRITYDNSATAGSGILERLADAILHEELTDENPHKVTHAEYPFMSEWQLDLRREREGVEIAESEGTDGKSHRKPTRRKRNGYETWYVDHHAKGRNKERREQYRKDTAPGEVATYNLYETGGALADEFVDCCGLGAHWATGSVNSPSP